MARRISRRTLLRGAGGVAIALPWLEIMGQPARAWAGGTTAQRFVTMYTPGGSVINDGSGNNRWRPSGTETDFTLSSILMPLEPMRHKLLIYDGLSLLSSNGHHNGGMQSWLSGWGQGSDGFGRGPSIDQVIAGLISADKPMRSLQVAVRWGTGRTHGLVHPLNSPNLEDAEGNNPIPPRLDPQAIFASLFSTLDPSTAPDALARVARKKSVLDYVDRGLNGLSSRLSGGDKQRVDQHLTKVRELEQALDEMPPISEVCYAPELIDTSDYNPDTGLNSNLAGDILDLDTDASIPKVGKFMMDMLVMALACDITGVASFQWTDTEAKHTFPWLDLPNHHHYYQHDGGFAPDQLEKIYTWYAGQHEYFLQQLDAIDLGGHSLLDETVVLFGSEVAQPSNHNQENMPFMLAGGGGGLRGGRFLRHADLADRSHNNLLLAILRLFGDERETFGNPEFCSAPFSDLT